MTQKNIAQLVEEDFNPDIKIWRNTEEELDLYGSDYKAYMEGWSEKFKSVGKEKDSILSYLKVNFSELLFKKYTDIVEDIDSGYESTFLFELDDLLAKEAHNDIYKIKKFTGLVEELQKTYNNFNFSIFKNVKENLKNYILLPGRTHKGETGEYTYTDMLVSKTISHSWNEGKSWNNIHKDLSQEGYQMLNIRQFVDFLNLLKSGNAKDGNHHSITKKELQYIYSEITQSKTLELSEWLDAKFSEEGNKIFINYDNRIVNGKLSPQRTEPLENDKRKNGSINYIMLRSSDVDLEDWLNNADYQGLPSRRSNGKFHYIPPKNRSLAIFSSRRLHCHVPLHDKNDMCGVRLARPIQIMKD